MAGTGMYLWRRNIPTSLKVIHARMVAQGGVIAGLCGVGVYTLMHEGDAAHSTSVVNHNKFQDVKVRKPVVAAAAPAVAAAPAAATPAKMEE